MMVFVLFDIRLEMPASRSCLISLALLVIEVLIFREFGVRRCSRPFL